MKVGDIVKAEFTRKNGGYHRELVVGVRESFVVVARGTTWRPWEVGGDKWLDTSFLVDDGEIEGTGLHHATRFDVEVREGFRIGTRAFRKIGHIQETPEIVDRYDDALEGKAQCHRPTKRP